MPEMLMCYEPGDRFATMATTGYARVWEVDDDGLIQPGFGLEPKEGTLPDAPPAPPPPVHDQGPPA